MGNQHRDEKNRQSEQEPKLAHYAAQVLRVFMKPVVSMLLAALALGVVSCKVGPNYSTPVATVAGHRNQFMKSCLIAIRHCGVQRQLGMASGDNYQHL